MSSRTHVKKTKYRKIVLEIVHLIYKKYFLRPKMYDVLGISHILRNAINIVWKKDIINYFTKLSLLNNMGKINERIERRESNK